MDDQPLTHHESLNKNLYTVYIILLNHIESELVSISVSGGFAHSYSTMVGQARPLESDHQSPLGDFLR